MIYEMIHIILNLHKETSYETGELELTIKTRSGLHYETVRLTWYIWHVNRVATHAACSRAFAATQATQASHTATSDNPASSAQETPSNLRGHFYLHI